MNARRFIVCLPGFAVGLSRGWSNLALTVPPDYSEPGRWQAKNGTEIPL
jgi:hypothetical protein